VSLVGLVLAACAAGLSGGGEALNGRRAPIDHIVVLHHNPFQYVRRIMETPEGRTLIRDASEFSRALRDGGLPSVAFVKPHWKDNAHAVSSTVGAGDRWVGEMVRAVMSSRYWPRVAGLITYDEGGGWFDHVRPPAVDRFGLGTRVPALVVSPYAKRGVRAGALDRPRPASRGAARSVRLHPGTACPRDAAVNRRPASA